MLEQVLPIILALCGLSLLIFVHELGHLIAAIQAKMEIEAFGIGFGRPVLSFIFKGIRFNLCWIPFGGYVKIVGMDSSSEAIDKNKVGFFSSSPLQRIKVAFAGPLANVLFALFVFSAIWLTGGRDKPFSEVTSRVGWIDPNSELYAKGLRPGDRIVAYAGRPLHSANDHIQAAMTSGNSLAVDFETIPTYTMPPKRISCVITPYDHPNAKTPGLLTTGVLAPSSFVVWNPYINHRDEEALSMPSVLESGIRSYDRIIWMDNVSIFSMEQLHEVLNDGTVLVSVIRPSLSKPIPIHLRVPRVKVQELKLLSEVKGELSDWQYMAGLQSKKMSDLWVLPYNITVDGIVEHPLSVIDSSVKMSKLSDTLLPGDHIVAVQGERVSHASQILKNIQDKKSIVIVERYLAGKEGLPIFSKDFSDVDSADQAFIKPFSSHAYHELIQTVGVNALTAAISSTMEGGGELVLLKPIKLFDQRSLINHIQSVRADTASRRTLRTSQSYNSENESQQENEPTSVTTQAQMKTQGDMDQTAAKRYVLGLVGVRDAAIQYNPDPLSMLFESVEDVFRTLSALLTGTLSPKWMAGPVGIVDSIQHQMAFGGFREAFFWLSILSVNLALLNLLPLPALDGGYILLSLIEIGTGLRPSAQALEKIVFPFILALVCLFIYLTYNDISRLILRFFGS